MTLKLFSSSKYYNIDEMRNIKIPHKNELISLFHINACALNKFFDDLNKHFDKNFSTSFK